MYTKVPATRSTFSELSQHVEIAEVFVFRSLSDSVTDLSKSIGGPHRIPQTFP